MGKQLNMAAEARSVGIDPQRIYNRMHKGDTFAQAIMAEAERYPEDLQARDNAVKALIETENEVDALEAQLAFGAKRCKLISLTLSVLVALMAAVVISG